MNDIKSHIYQEFHRKLMRHDICEIWWRIDETSHRFHAAQQTELDDLVKRLVERAKFTDLTFHEELRRRKLEESKIYQFYG